MDSISLLGHRAQAYWWFGATMVLAGVGSSPLTTILIDDHDQLPGSQLSYSPLSSHHHNSTISLLRMWSPTMTPRYMESITSWGC
jgi:hypothetical protein